VGRGVHNAVVELDISAYLDRMPGDDIVYVQTADG
jgi:hypothetical protein